MRLLFTSQYYGIRLHTSSVSLYKTLAYQVTLHIRPGRYFFEPINIDYIVFNIERFFLNNFLLSYKANQAESCILYKTVTDLVYFFAYFFKMT